MRRRTTARLGLVLGLIAGWATALPAQPRLETRRPQAKVIHYEPATESAAVVAVMGQVGRPRTYQFPAAPTLEDALTAAKGISDPASEMVRIVRGRRVQSVAYSAAARQQLQSGDLVIVDPPARTAGRQPLAASPGVQIALIGVLSQPVIVYTPREHATADLIVQKLGQPRELLSTMGAIAPPGAAIGKSVHAPLPEGTVLLFDPMHIRKESLPDDLPQVLPCGLPEPEMGAYGLHHAYEERPQPELPVRRQPMLPPVANRSPSLPAPAESTPIPLPEEPPAKISPARQSSDGPTISTVPFSNDAAPQSARRNRLTGLAPSKKQSSAADAKPPVWKKLPRPAAEDMDDIEIESDDPPKTSGPFSIWQMLGIVLSVAFLVGLALAARVLQQRWQSQTATADEPVRKEKESERIEPSRKEPSPRPIKPTPVAAAPAHPAKAPAEPPDAKLPEVQLPAESPAIVPRPHLPMQRFATAAAPQDVPADRAAWEVLIQRQTAFAQILKQELPIVEEPLALRPGIPLVLPPVQQTIWRHDDAASPIQPHIAPPETAPVPRPHLDAPHARFPSGPHMRLGSEAPVERALRQLQGGRS